MTSTSEKPSPFASVRERSRPNVIPSSLLALVILVAGCHGASFDTAPDADIAPAKLFMFAPLPHQPQSLDAKDAARVNLGRQLYYDTHLSSNNSVSCNTCHQLAKYGVDGLPHSLGHDRRPGGRNAPTVYNAGLEFAQFWDGRAADLAAQAAGPMMNPVEMGMSGPDVVVSYVRSNPRYVDELKEAFPQEKDPVSLHMITTSIAAFESGLLTPSRWDRYLQGDTAALSEGEKQGLRVFLRSGCAACHAGRDMGGNSYEQLGAFHDWPDEKTDIGRETVTGQSRDKMFLKVPTLRNIDQTGPYFHDGQTKTLEEAVRKMGRFETGTHLSDADVNSIVTFLHALTGEIPSVYIQPPAASAPKNSTMKGGL